MRELSFTLVLAALSLSLLAPACKRRSDTPDATTPARDPAVEQRPPPGTRIEAWPEVGTRPEAGRELSGSGDPFLWERHATEVPPKAQIPLRLHRPFE